MTKVEIEDSLKDLIDSELDIDKELIKSESNFVNDLGFDSLDVVDFIMKSESKYQISIPDEDAEKISTFGEFVTYLDKRLNG